MKTAWRYLLAFGLVGSLTATSCVIKTDPDGTGGSDNDTGGRGNGGSSTGGSKATGGSMATGGSSTGGSTATGGSKSTGGTPATGGTATVIGCDGTDFRGEAAMTCTFEDDDLADPDIGECLKCISKAANCCDDLKDCYATDPNNQCGFGGPEGESEYICYQTCLVGKAKAGGGLYDPDRDTDACADACATPACLPKPIGSVTNSLIGCMHLNCETECFFDPAM